MTQVSVIIPAYNAVAYLGEAIRSALSQSCTDIEVIVVDDASTDETANLVRQMATQDARLRLVQALINGGAGASRNLGLAAARGTWIALLDADDSFLPTRLAHLLGVAERDKADMVSDNLLLREASGNVTIAIPPERLSGTSVLSPAAFINGCITTSRTPERDTLAFLKPIMRRDFLQGHGIAYDATCRSGEDFLLYLDCLLAGARWIAIAEPMYVYAVRAGSATETLSRADQRKLIDRSRTLSRDAIIRRDSELSRALHQHWRNLAPIHYYYSLRDAVRARDLRATFRVLTRDRAAIALIAEVVLNRLTQLRKKAVLF